MGARRESSFGDRVAEYVDSPLLTHRLRRGEILYGQIDGSFGIYAARVNHSGEVEGRCTCPSEIWPCKHLHALRATWDTNPKSFFDLDLWLQELAAEPKETLVKAIASMVEEYPELLSVFGVPGFEPADEEDDMHTSGFLA
jgi:uncharacterized Zn finger protein